MVPIPTTIKDVALAAGVSVTTVSRALNGYSDVGEDTRRKIQRVAKELNYRPSAVARSLVMNRTKTIGLLISDMLRNSTAHHFTFEVLRGLHDRLAEHGYDLLLASTSTAQQRLLSYLDFCTERRFDGVIVMGIRLDDPYMYEVTESSLSSVVIDIPLLSEHCGYVMTDNVRGSELAVQHLNQRGHTRIGFVNGYLEAEVSISRLRGYKEALERLRLPFDEALVFEGDFSIASGAEGMRALLGANPDLSAVFFASDLMAIGGLRWALQQGIRVPEDMAIVGFDNIDLAEFVTPGLTTIHQKRYEMGVAAANLLVNMLKGESPEGRVLSPEIVVREST